MMLFDQFNDLRIRFKLLIIYSAVFVLSLALVSLIIHAFVRKTLEKNIESELQNTTTTILNMVKTAADVSIKNHLRAVAEKNREVAAYFHDQFSLGILDEATAMNRAQEVLLSQTIGKTGYIYCVSSDGVIVIHPKKGLLGADLSKHAFIVEQMHRKNGYLEYDWKNPEEQESRPKALYMTYFEPWDWIISVSSYRSEFNELVNVDDFEDRILSLRFGKTGYSFVMDTHGTLIIHPALKGKNFLHATDANGRRYIEDICLRKNGKIVYAWASTRTIKGGSIMKENPLCASVLADVAEEIAIARFLIDDLARLIAKMAGPHSPELQHVYTMSQIVGYRVQQGTLRAVNRGMELMGSAGYAREWHAEKHWRDIKTIQSYLCGVGAEVPVKMDTARFFFDCKEI